MRASSRTRWSAAFLATSLCAGAAAAQAPCDRACTIAVTDRYLAAVTSHDPAAAPLAGDVRFVENARRMPVGEGLWQSITGGPTAFSIHVPDPVNHSAGWIGMMERQGKPVLVALRLKLEGDRISEVEHRVTDVRDTVLDRLKTPRAGLLADVPANKRLDHAELIRIGGSYYDALDDNDGTKCPSPPIASGRKTAWLRPGKAPEPAPPARASRPSPATARASSPVV